MILFFFIHWYRVVGKSYKPNDYVSGTWYKKVQMRTERENVLIFHDAEKRQKIKTTVAFSFSH